MQYLAETMTDTGYTDDLALLAFPTSCKSQLHRLAQTVWSNGLYMKANKTEFMSFKQGDNFSTLSGNSPKLVDKFIHLGSKKW